MKKFILAALVLLLIGSVSAKTVTFHTDEPMNVTINNEQVELELVGVNPADNADGLSTATFLRGDMTLTVQSWNAHEFNRIPSRINGEYVGLMEWTGQDTDNNRDDTATLSWGNSFFACESYQPERNQIKFCGEGIKRWQVGDSYETLEFMYVRETDDLPQVKQAVFINSENMTLTVTSENAEQYQRTNSKINGVEVYAIDTRGAGTTRGSDDAVILEKEKTTCTYDFTGTVNNGNSEGSIYIGGSYTQLTRENTFGFTKTADCGSTVNVTYYEERQPIQTKEVEVPEQNSEVKVEMNIDPEKTTEYSERHAEQVTNYLGGAVKNVSPRTEILFGDNLRNQLYIHEIRGDYLREAVVTMSPRSKDGPKFNLTWDNMVRGVTKEFHTGSYTVHGCGDTSPENLKISISKKLGMNGYGACFTESEVDEGSFNPVDYTIGENAEVSKGDVLVFGPANENKLYINEFIYNENIDLYSLESYANKLRNNKEIRPVQGTVTEAYFYTGKYPVHFCSYRDEQATVVVSDQGVSSDQACEEEVKRPEGTVNLGSDRYPYSSPVTVETDIHTQGNYKLKASINGDPFFSTGLEKIGTSESDIRPSPGNLTVRLVAPGTWWNPLDSTRTIATDYATIYEQEQEEGPSCMDMIENAQDHADRQNVCGQTTAEMRCGDGERNYTAKNSCEISYLNDRGWEAVGSPEQEAELSVPVEEIRKGTTLNITTNNGQGNKLVIKGPRTSTEYTVTQSFQVFNIDTSNLSKGTYTAKILPQTQAGGLLNIGIIEDLIGEPIDSAQFEVKSRYGWKSYCRSKGLRTGTVDDQIRCIEGQIVPTCFTENPGEKCRRVAEDLCEDLLGYSFSTQKGTCQAR